jgi:hypothetical protein
METQIGRSDYPLPEGLGRFRAVALAMGDMYLDLYPISPGAIRLLRQTRPGGGLPTYYAVTDKMELWPTPSGEWEVARCWEGAHQCRPK